MQKETGRQRMKHGGGAVEWGGGRHAPTLEERTEASRKGRRVASLGGYGRGALGGQSAHRTGGGEEREGLPKVLRTGWQCGGWTGEAGGGGVRWSADAPSLADSIATEFDARGDQRNPQKWGPAPWGVAVGHRTRCRAVWTVSHGQLPHPHAGMNDRRWVLTIRRQGRTWAQTMNNIWQGGPWWEGGGNGNATESGGTL